MPTRTGSALRRLPQRRDRARPEVIARRTATLPSGGSGPVMEGLHVWLVRQFDERRVEPNSGLGKAISYLLRHWEKLTLFLRVAGAPLDNNICEQALKKAIRQPCSSSTSSKSSNSDWRRGRCHPESRRPTTTKSLPECGAGVCRSSSSFRLHPSVVVPSSVSSNWQHGAPSYRQAVRSTFCPTTMVIIA